MVCRKTATPTIHNSDNPYFTSAAGPSRNSPLPIDAPSTMTPGPTALNQPNPCGRGASGSSPRRHGSSPEMDSLEDKLDSYRGQDREHADTTAHCRIAVI